jgi:signal transduction histidine kinase
MRRARSCCRPTATARAHLIGIADDGPGISEPKREALMRRHARADETGTGLGLSIASDIAAAAGGTLTLEGGGPGLTAVLALPMARPAPGRGAEERA